MDAPIDYRAPTSPEVSAGSGGFAAALFILLIGGVLLAIFTREPGNEPAKEKATPVVAEPDPRPGRRY
jgi:hypothetical protein